MQTVAVIELETEFEGETHLEWAAKKAKAIARKMGFRDNSEQAADLVATAHLILWRRALTFQPHASYGAGESVHGHFRGYVALSIKFDCEREARRLKGGGTFPNPTEETDAVRVVGLPRWTNELGEEEDDVSDTASDPDADEAISVLIDRAELEATEEEVIRALYGLGCEQQTHAQMAKAWHVGEELIREYEAAALAKLRRFAVFAGLLDISLRAPESASPALAV